jgi:hypothetical protein
MHNTLGLWIVSNTIKRKRNLPSINTRNPTFVTYSSNKQILYSVMWSKDDRK